MHARGIRAPWTSAAMPACLICRGGRVARLGCSLTFYTYISLPILVLRERQSNTGDLTTNRQKPAIFSFQNTPPNPDLGNGICRLGEAGHRPCRTHLIVYYWPRIKSLDTLDCRAIRSGLYLPALTHVTIGPGSIYFTGFLHLLCQIAPNLHHLDADRQLAYIHEVQPPPFPDLERDTRLERLRVYNLDGGGVEEDDEGDEECIVLLQRSPNLRVLSLDLSAFANEDQVQVIEACNSLQHLQSLYFYDSLETMHTHFGTGKLLCSARNLALGLGLWWHPVRSSDLR